MLRGLVITFFGVVVVLSIVVLALTLIPITIDLSGFRGAIESGASRALGREVVLAGSLTATTGLAPRIDIGDVRVGNPPEWSLGEMARLKNASAQIRLLPLLKGEIRVDDFSVQGLQANLESEADGHANWQFESSGQSAAQDTVAHQQSPMALKFVELGNFSLRDILLSYKTPERADPLVLELKELRGVAESGQDIMLSLEGALQRAPYRAEITTGSLAAAMAPTEPWPLKFSAGALGARLSIDATLEAPLQGRGIDGRFDFSGSTLKDVEELLNTELPELDDFRIAGRIREAGDHYQLQELVGSIAGTAFAGVLEADFSGGRPIFSGDIEIPTVDLAPALTAIRDQEEGAGSDTSATPPITNPAPTSVDTDKGGAVDLDALILTFEPFSRFDANFRLRVGEALNGPLGFENASLQVTIDDGELTAPVAATLAGVPFRGEISLSGHTGVPEVRISLDAERSDIGRLAEFVIGAEGVEGRFAEAGLEFEARGETLRSLLRTSELGLELSEAYLSYGNETGGTPVEFTLSAASMLFPAARESTVTARGTLLGEPFSLAFNGGTFIDNFVNRSWPIEFSASGGGAELQIDGAVRRVGADGGSEIAFSLNGERIGGMAAWLGISPDAGQSYALRGTTRISSRGVSLNVDEARIGNSSFTGELGLDLQGETPVTILDLAFEQLDLKGLSVLLSGRERGEPPQTGKEALTVDVPILPTGIALFDSDLDITIERVRMDPSDTTDVAFSAKIRNGFMAGAPVGLAVGGAQFDGSFSLDLRDDVPKVGAEINSKNVDVGRLLSELDIATGLDVTARSFEMDLTLEGASVRQILERSEFTVAASEGVLKIRPPGVESGVSVRLEEGTLSARRGEPISLRMNGSIQETPVRIGLSTHGLAEFAESKERLSTRMDIALANANLSLTGTAPLPVNTDNLHFTMDFGGERFSDFDDLLDVSLPPVGPYRVRGKFGSRKSGYYVEDLELGVGDSRLTGDLDFQTVADPPRLDVNLRAQSIQLDDFDVGDWSPSGEDEDSSAASDSQSAGRKLVEKEEEIRAILSPAVMRSLDGRIGVQVEQVLSGQDRLGSGQLILTLKDGRLAANPLALEVPGGNVDLRLGYEPTETEVMLEAAAEVSDFDYGILARRIDPVSDVAGDITVDIDISTRGPSLERVMEEANGHMNFDVRPKDLNAEIFDLWAVNLFLALMPSLDTPDGSTVNCIVGRFQLEDGTMRPVALLIDSTRIQASGDGTIDFKTDTIDFTAAPRAKRPQMFSAKTPLQVTGTFTDFDIGLAPGAAFGTGVRMITSPVVVPFQWIFSKSEAPDGKVACETAWIGEDQARDSLPLP